MRALKPPLTLPLLAARFLFKDRKLFVLALLPGVVTMFLTFAGAFALWTTWFFPLTWWISLPLLLISVPAIWLVVGNLALFPFEDALIDRTQIVAYGSVRIPTPAWSAKRIASEILQSLFLIGSFGVLLLLALLPGLGFLSALAGSWLTAWGFLSPLLARMHFTARERRRAFFAHPLRNTAFGFFLNALLFVPLLNVWLQGYAVILATLLESWSGLRSGGRDPQVPEVDRLPSV